MTHIHRDDQYEMVTYYHVILGSHPKVLQPRHQHRRNCIPRTDSSRQQSADLISPINMKMVIQWLTGNDIALLIGL